MCGWMDGWVGVWVCGWMDEWVGGQMDGDIISTHLVVNHISVFGTPSFQSLTVEFQNDSFALLRKVKPGNFLPFLPLCLLLLLVFFFKQIKWLMTEVSW